MVGLFPLAPHQDLLQYIHHVPFNANGVKTEALQSPPPWNNIVLGVPIHIQFAHQISKFCRSIRRSIIYLNFQDQAPRLP